LAGDKSSTIAEKQPQQPDSGTESHGWFRENVLNPFINGTGVRQIKDTFTGEDYKPLETGKQDSLVNNAVQTVSEVVGGLTPYIILGKASHTVMGSFAEARQMTGVANTLMRSEAVANVGTAGLYEALKKPTDGQTRLGNSVGTMLSFSAFEAGNYGMSKLAAGTTSRLGKIAVVGTGRALTGAVGGELQYETSNLVAGYTGGKNQAENSGRIQAVLSGALMNEALPLAQQGLGKALKLSLGNTDAMRVKSSADAGSDTAPASSKLTESGSKPLSAVEAGVRKLADVRDRAAAMIAGGTVGKPGLAFNGYEGVPASDAADAMLPKVDLVEDAAKAHGGDAVKPEARIADKTEQPAKTETVIPEANIGKPEVGSTITQDGRINFGLRSPQATNVELVLYDTPNAKEPSRILPMTRTGEVWHRSEELPEFTAYQYRVSGEFDPEGKGLRFDNTKLLLDPEAKAVFRADTSPDVNDARAVAVRTDFDWQGVKKPNTSMADTVIYELNVRGFTAGDKSLGDLRGTYRGLVEKIPYLKKLGITAVELMPVMEFQKDMKVDPATGKVLLNAWGYNTVGFKAVEGRYAHDGTTGQQVAEFQNMVRELHRNGIEVLMDVVFNHTGEGGADGKTVNFKSINNNEMYLLDKNNQNGYVDHTGCGNTVNANDPAVQDFIIKSLRYWVQEMQVDGFRFDLAKALKYMPDGNFNDTAPLIEAIKNDPVLSKVKLIAEPWDTSGYGPGRFAQGWAEWNGHFRDVVRQFVRGMTGQVKYLGDVIAGSSGAGFNPDTGQPPVNFVTAHDGFTMNDLVSYDSKHNESNGENNRDGNDDNASRNYGHEGPVEKGSPIDMLRVRQIKNFMSWLFLSQGTPMLLSGDEMRRTQDGNNNAYNQDKLNEVDWNSLEENKRVFDFTQWAIGLRKALNIGYMRPNDIIWHGVRPFAPDWGDGSRFIARQFKAVGDSNKSIYVAGNSWEGPVDFDLPPGTWYRIADTNMAEGQDFKPLDQGDLMDSSHYTLMPYTTAIFVQDVQPSTSRPISATAAAAASQALAESHR
jgi:isoamylase